MNFLFLTIVVISSGHNNFIESFNFNGYWTYSPSFEAMSGLHNNKLPGPGEDNLFLIPHRNSFRIGNNTVYSCRICKNYKTVSSGEYVKHAKEKHFFPGHEKEHNWMKELTQNQDYNYTCNVCNEAYKSEPALLWHLTKFDHFDIKEKELCTYLKARLVLNETIGRKVVHHQMMRPFYKERQPENDSFCRSSILNELCYQFDRATYVPNVGLSSGDVSNQQRDSDIIKAGWSKYCRSDFEKRHKKVNGVNVYQRSPEVKEEIYTDEVRDEERKRQEAAVIQATKDEFAAFYTQDTKELDEQEGNESYMDEEEVRNQIEEYGPWASHEDHVGDKKRRRITFRRNVTKPNPNERDYNLFEPRH